MKLKTKFQDKDFELGETAEVSISSLINNKLDKTIKVYAMSLKNGTYYSYFYDSIKDFTDHWEDALEKPKKHYEILGIGVVIERNNEEDDIFRCANQREIGNYFETEEEAKKAVEKLKAFNRLKANGFKFTEWGVGFDKTLVIKAKYSRGQIYDDMNLLFGGEE